MVRATSAVTAAVVAMSVASGLAMPTDYDAALMERSYDDYELDARDSMIDIDAREMLDSFSNFDAREYEEFDARDLQNVLEYIREVPTTTTSSHATSTPTNALKTVTQTFTHHPKPTPCTNDELKANKKKWEEEKKEKEAQKKNKHYSSSTTSSSTPSSTSTVSSFTHTSVGPIETGRHGRHYRHHHGHGHHSEFYYDNNDNVEFARKMHHLQKEHLINENAEEDKRWNSYKEYHHLSSATAATSTSAASKITSAPGSANHSESAKVSTETHTGKHGTVTFKVTTTAATPECTKPSLLERIKQHHRREFDDAEGSLFTRDYGFDELD